MATFEYVEIPADAVRLKPASLEPAAKILASLPDAPRTSSHAAPDALGPAKSALALVPQLLLSSSASSPPLAGTASIISSAIATQNPRSSSNSLLSTRDPLSVHIMSANFRRFVSRVGPFFWLQDRIEEVILWKRGWKRTTVWLAAYGFFCCFPKMTLLIPHMLLLGIMLGYYPDAGARQIPINVGESTADWQANIQAIQNLMGAYSDAHDAIVPLLPLLTAPPTPLPTPSPPRSHAGFSSVSTPKRSSSNESAPKFPRRTSDPLREPTYRLTQPHHPLLIVTLVTFLLLIPLLMTDLLPLRFLFFLAGAGGIVALHPRFRGLFSTISTALSGSGPGISFQISLSVPRLPNPLSLLPFVLHHVRHQSRAPCRHTFAFTFTLTPRDIFLFFRRFVDDDRLENAVWTAPVAHVELWENERWVQDASTSERKRRKSTVTFMREDDDEGGGDVEDDTASTTSSATVTAGLADAVKAPERMTGTWSKANLKPIERAGWTRGRDGWSGVGAEVSNLTFSLSPGWTFVETEGWRPDLVAAWAVQGKDEASSASVCVGADEDGWTYTTDTWTHPRPDARTWDGWVTRRRRWVRRVYFRDVER